MMTPIEQIPNGTLVFLKCGCGALKALMLPTGTAAIVEIKKACQIHASESTRALSLSRGELVSAFTRATDD